MRSREVRCRVVRAAVLLAIGLTLLGVPAAQASTTSCSSADTTLEEEKLEQARKEYLDVLAGGPSSTCAADGLQKVTQATRVEARLCSEGKLLTEAKQAQQARRRYVAALAKNVESECASAGLGVTKKAAGDEKSWLETWKSWTTNALALIASVAVAVLVLLGAGLVMRMVLGRPRRSLTLEPFADGAVEAKVGSTVAGLVETQLVALARRSRHSKGDYSLDLVVADVELRSSNQSLSATLSGLGETSQFKLAVAVLGLLDRTFGTHLVTKGELVPKGPSGHGLLLSMNSQKPGNSARGALWDAAGVHPGAHLPAPPAPAPAAPVPAGAPAAASGAAKEEPDPYYQLVDRAAAWVQYEAACRVDNRVKLITTSADSFSLVAAGLTAQRAGEVMVAARTYGRALQAESENVAALFNLGLILARHTENFVVAEQLLQRALEVLKARYEDMP